MKLNYITNMAGPRSINPTTT